MRKGPAVRILAGSGNGCRAVAAVKLKTGFAGHCRGQPSIPQAPAIRMVIPQFHKWHSKPRESHQNELTQPICSLSSPGAVHDLLTILLGLCRSLSF